MSGWWNSISGMFSGGAPAPAPGAEEQSSAADRPSEDAIEEVRRKRLERLGAAEGSGEMQGRSPRAVGATAVHVAAPQPSPVGPAAVAAKPLDARASAALPRAATAAPPSIPVAAATPSAVPANRQAGSAAASPATTTTFGATATAAAASSPSPANPPRLPVSSPGITTTTATKSPMKAIDDEPTLLRRVLCVPSACDVPLSCRVARDLMEHRLTHGSYKGCEPGVPSATVPGVRQAVSTAAASLTSKLDYLVFCYNNAAEVCGVRGPVKGLPAPTTKGADAIKQTVGRAVMDAAVDFTATLIGTDMYGDGERSIGRGQGRAALSGITAADDSAAMPGENAASRAFWSMIIAATDSRTTHFPAPGTVDAMLSLPMELLSDVSTQLEEVVGAGGLVDLVSPCTWRLLRACQATSNFNSPERVRALALAHTMALSKPLARALVQTPAFTGSFAQQLPGAPKHSTAPATSTAGMPPRMAQMFAQINMMTSVVGSAPANPGSGRHYETNTILGCLLSPSPLPGPMPPVPGLPPHASNMMPSPVLDQFSDLQHTGVQAVEASITSIRNMQASIVDGTHQLMLTLLKADVKGAAVAVAREGVLGWTRDVLVANAGRNKEVTSGWQLSSDGMMLNLAIVLCKMCEPIVAGAKPLLSDPPASSSTSGASDGGGGARPSSSSSQQHPVDKVALIDPHYIVTCDGMDKLFDAAAPRLVASGQGSGEAGAGTGSGVTGSPVIAAGAGAGSAGADDADWYGDDAGADTADAAAATSSSAAIVPRRPDSDFSFVTRVFFYCIRALQLGVCPLIRKTKQEDRMLSQLQHMMRQPAGAGGDAGRAESLKEEFDYQVSNKVACDTVRLDPAVLTPAVRTCGLIFEWVGRVCAGAVNTDASATPSCVTVVPFPAAPYEIARSVPESFVSCVVEVLDFLGSARDAVTGGHASVPVLSSLSQSPFELPSFLSVITALLSSPKVYVRSPHLRAQMGDAVFGLFAPLKYRPGEGDDEDGSGGAGSRRGTDPATLTSMHVSNPTAFVASHLASALMALYGDVEATGFYEKQTHRMKVAALLNYIWSLPSHKPAFHSIASATHDDDDDGFVSFANGIIGHTTSVLTESLKGLPLIRDTLRSMADAATWNAYPQEERDRRQSQLDDTTSLVKSSLMLASQTTPLLAVLTEDGTICRGFMRGELVGRLAAMLVRAVTDLGGPRGLELKVDRPEQYGFRPRELLKDLLTATLHLSSQPAFVSAVAESGLWREAEWSKVASVADRIQLLPPSGTVSMAALRAFIKSVEQAAAAAQEEESLLEGFPDEYADPILCILMRDPVKTPSGRVYDRSSITQQLLNNPVDPYTRQPLTAADLVPDTELKARIEEWVKERLAQARAAASGAGGGVGAADLPTSTAASAGPARGAAAAPDAAGGEQSRSGGAPSPATTPAQYDPPVEPGALVTASGKICKRCVAGYFTVEKPGAGPNGGPLRVPLCAVPTALPYGGTGLHLFYSDHEGLEALRPAAVRFMGDSNDIDSQLGRFAFNPNVSWGLPACPMDEDDAAAGLVLAGNEYVHNSHKFKEELAGMIEAGVVVDTGRRWNKNYYRNLPIVRFTQPINPATGQVVTPAVYPGKLSQ